MTSNDQIAATPPTVLTPVRPGAASVAALNWAVQALALTVWISAAIFGVYILALYVGAIGAGTLQQWNKNLPKLYEPQAASATIGIGMHFLAGAVLLALGPIQFIGSIRSRMPAVHRWIGRIYTAGAAAAGVGGLLFIALKGTVGGTPMNVGFALYGVLTVLAAMKTALHAWRRELDRHRAWAIRLFALAIGSWLYRMDYGFWALAANGAGHTKAFDGPFDVVMSFFFFIPNLVVAEAIIRARHAHASVAMRSIAATLLTAATGFVVLGTYYFTRYHWGPGILARLIGGTI